MIRQFENLQFDNKSNLGIIQITGRRCTHSGPPVKLRFTALYTFPPLYTQKPAARRVFVFSEGGLRCPVFSARQVWRLKIADRGPSAASLPRPQDAVGGPARCQAGFCVFGRRVAVPCIFCAPSVALENSRPRPQRRLPASSAGRGRRPCPLPGGFLCFRKAGCGALYFLRAKCGA